MKKIILIFITIICISTNFSYAQVYQTESTEKISFVDASTNVEYEIKKETTYNQGNSDENSLVLYKKYESHLELLGKIERGFNLRCICKITVSNFSVLNKHLLVEYKITTDAGTNIIMEKYTWENNFFYFFRPKNHI